MGKKAFLLALARGARGKDGAKALILPDYYIDGSAGAEGVPQTVSGDAPLHFENALRTPLEHLITNILPIQDLHGYDAPWPAGGGVNKLSTVTNLGSITINGMTVQANEDGTFSLNGTTSGGSFDNTYDINAEYVVQDGDYLHIHNTMADSSSMILLRFTDNTQVSGYFSSVNYSRSLTDAVGKTINAIRIYISSGVTLSGTISPEIVKAATSSQFSPYANICPISGWQTITAWDDAKCGGNIEWNQLIQNGNFANGTTGWTIAAEWKSREAVDNVLHLVSTQNQYPYININHSCPNIVGHKYFGSLRIKASKASRVDMSIGATAGHGIILNGVSYNADTWNLISGIGSPDAYTSDVLYIRPKSSIDAEEVDIYITDIFCCDLTAMFGAGNEPSTVEEFRALFPKDYYAYNAGTHTSVGEVNGSGYWKVPVTFGALGKNLLDNTELSDYTNWSSTAIGGSSYQSNVSNRTYNLPTIAGNTYTLSFGISADSFPTYLILGKWAGTGYDAELIARFSSTTSFVQSSYTFSADDGYIYYLRMGSTGSEASFNEQMVNVSYSQLELGSSATSYEPYTDTIYYGTLDLATGDGTIDTATVTLDGNTPTNVFSVTALTNYTQVSYTPYIGVGVAGHDFICSTLKSGTADGLYRIWGSSVPRLFMGLPTSVTNAADAVAWFAENSTQIVYPLADPIPFHIDGLSIKPLKGDNNVWTDCGDTLSATYTVNAPVKTLEVTGEPPLSLPYSVGKPLKAWSVELSPYQDLHGYDHPWPGGAVANKWDEDWEAGMIGWSGQNLEGQNKIRSKGYISVTPGNVYRIITPTNLQFFYYDSTKQFVSYENGSKANNTTITIPADCYYARFYTYQNYGTAYKNDIAINYPATVTTYSPYSNICPILGTDKLNIFAEESYDPSATPKAVLTLPQTVYTGTIGSEGGESRWGVVDLGTLNWSYNSGALRFDCTNSRIIGAKSVPNSEVPNAYCTQYDVVKYNDNYGAAGPDNIVFFDFTLLRVRDKRFTDATAFKTAMQGVKLVYELATPTTFAVPSPTIPTPTGTATTWATAEDGTVDDMTVTYKGHVMPGGES